MLLEERLRGLAKDELAALLGVRTDVVVAPQPRTLRELAHRLSTPESIGAALESLPLPALQLAEAIAALGGRPTAASLEQFVGRPDAIGEWLDALQARSVAWRASGRIESADGLLVLFGSPLNLGPGLTDVLAYATVDQMRTALRAAGRMPGSSRKAEVRAALEEFWCDPDAVREVAAGLPDQVRSAIAAGVVDDDDEFDYYGEAWDRERRARQAAGAAGLGIVRSWGDDVSVPAEVVLALRGSDYRAPFAPAPPPAAMIGVDPGRLIGDSAAAITVFTDRAVALLDLLTRTPAAALKSGGVGVRELTRLAKVLTCDLDGVRLVGETCAQAGLIAAVDGRVAVTAQGVAWREAEPARRAEMLLHAWWAMPFVASEATDGDGKPRAALATPACRGCLLARRNMLGLLAECPAGNGFDAVHLARRAGWRRPLVHVAEPDELPYARHLAEATELGLVVDGVLTDLGRALVEDRDLTAVLADVLPAATDVGLFGADLTVVVAGTATARVSALLDACADRESSGGATVWRIGPGSVRRALDEGWSADDLETRLAGIAAGPLPQALGYLIRDVGRRYGSLVVGPATSAIRSEDTALLAQLAADRSLRKLGLRMLAPTVLAADVPVEHALQALRSAGYLPRPEQVGAPQNAAQEPAPALADAIRPRRSTSPAADPDELAARLIGAGDVPERSPVELAIARRARGLSGDEIGMLARAVHDRSAVRIDYESSSGARTRRIIVRPELEGDVVLAWCQLRADERWFRLDRILAVAPAAP